MAAAFLGFSCTGADPGTQVHSTNFSSPSDSSAPDLSADLKPPEPFVMAADGTTKMSLVDAGIFNAGAQHWAVVLGKALFWDQQMGSHGYACASCHFHAGADTRLRNELNPGLKDVVDGPNGDTQFGSTRSDTGTVLPGHMPSGAVAGSDYLLKKADFPLFRLEDETDRNSPVVTDTDDRVGAEGTFAEKFQRVRPWGFHDQCSDADASIYHAGEYGARQVEPRQAPSVVNAVFNFRNFWDNRANNLFNGIGTFGMSEVLGDAGKPDDPRNNNRLVVIENGKPTLTYLKVENSSLASQSMSPPVAALETSCAGRTFADIGRKLLSTLPLLRQQVSSHDSVLGPYVSRWGEGLSWQYRYAALIRKVFPRKYWALPGRYRIEHGQLVRDPRGYTQMELNFSMFWGLAIQAYEETLVADRSELDALQKEGRLVVSPFQGCSSPTGDVDPLLLRGCTIFFRINLGPGSPTQQDGIRGGNCVVCHTESNFGFGDAVAPMLSEGAFQQGEDFPLFLPVANAQGVPALRDNGSANIGLRPVFSDLEEGANGPFGEPLSFGMQYWKYLHGDKSAVVDPPLARLIASGNAPPASAFDKLEVDGSAKIPILRNVALTPPYFAWGGYATLRQVMRVYNRGLDRRDITGADDPNNDGSHCTSGDDTGTGPTGTGTFPMSGNCATNTTSLLFPLGLSDCDANGEGKPNQACIDQHRTVKNDDLAALVRFFKSLTDRRVQCDQAPFDHPELVVINGQSMQGSPSNNEADDLMFDLPATGAKGYSPTSGYCIPNSGDLFAPGMQARSGGDKVAVHACYADDPQGPLCAYPDHDGDGDDGSTYLSSSQMSH